MLERLAARGAKFPAEHNVGHLYEAEPVVKEFHRQLDPTNTFNPGIGKTGKKTALIHLCGLADMHPGLACILHVPLKHYAAWNGAGWVLNLQDSRF